MSDLFDEVLDSPDTKLPEHSITLCLAGTALREWRELKGQQPEANEGIDDDRLNTPMVKPNPERKAKLDKLEAKIRKHTVKFIVAALPSPDWNELYAAHPPRKGSDGVPLATDAALGINPATFYQALVRRSVITPVMTDERWEKLTPVLSDAQFDKLAALAWLINSRDQDVPFGLAN